MTAPLPSSYRLPIAGLVNAVARLAIRRGCTEVAELEARLTALIAQQQQLKGARP